MKKITIQFKLNLWRILTGEELQKALKQAADTTRVGSIFIDKETYQLSSVGKEIKLSISAIINQENVICEFFIKNTDDFTKEQKKFRLQILNSNCFKSDREYLLSSSFVKDNEITGQIKEIEIHQLSAISHDLIHDLN